MVLTVILSTGLQLLLYWLLRRKKYAGILIFLLFLVLNFFLYPILWIESSPLNREGLNCGMYAIGYFFFFWIIGGSSVLMAHFVRWLLLLRLRRRQRIAQSQSPDVPE